MGDVRALPRVLPDQRALILGATGSGKTTGAAWLLSRSPGQWVVLNSKYDPLLSSLGPGVEWDVGAVQDGLRKSRVVVAHPSFYDQSSLDEVLFDICESGQVVGVMVDELLYLSKGNGQCGPGLMALLTRGRARGQPFIGCSQRPANITQYAYTESTYFGVFTLRADRDWARVIDYTQCPELRRQREPHFWGWFDTRDNRLTEYGPVPRHDIARRFKTKNSSGTIIA